MTDNDKISMQLRENKFQESFCESIKNCPRDQDLSFLIEILGLLINYSLYNERDFERHGGYSAL